MVNYYTLVLFHLDLSYAICTALKCTAYAIVLLRVLLHDTLRYFITLYSTTLTPNFPKNIPWNIPHVTLYTALLKPRCTYVRTHFQTSLLPVERPLVKGLLEKIDKTLSIGVGDGKNKVRKNEFTSVLFCFISYHFILFYICFIFFIVLYQYRYSVYVNDALTVYILIYLQYSTKNINWIWSQNLFYIRQDTVMHFWCLCNCAWYYHWFKVTMFFKDCMILYSIQLQYYYLSISVQLFIM